MTQVTVESAIDLKADQVKLITAKIKAQFGDSVQIRFITDPSLVAGLRIASPAGVIDHSLKSRLTQLKAQLLS